MKSEKTIPFDNIEKRWSEEFSQYPVLQLFFRELEAQEEAVETIDRERGFDVRLLTEVNGMPNRAHLRIYFATEGKCVLFFHKKSSIPFSRDRFSYGGVVIDSRSTGRFNEHDVQEWIEFLRNGLQPKQRPKTLKKSFPYTIPED